MENKPVSENIKKNAFNPAAFDFERVGINPIAIEKDETIYIEVNSANVEIYQMKNGETVDFVMVTNLETGEEGHFWLAGQLRHQFEKLAEGKALLGSKFKITNLGKQKTEIMNPENNKIESREVNQFDIFKLVSKSKN